MGTCCSSKSSIVASTQPESTKRLIKKMQSTTNNHAESGSSSDEETYREFDTAIAASGEDSDDSSGIPILSAKDQQAIMNGFKDAIIKSNDSLVKYYLKEHSELNLLSTRFKNGDTCLHIAVKNKAYQLIKFLLSQDETLLSPNFQNDDGDTSLQAAAYSREVLSVQLLLFSSNNNKADAEVTNHQKETALMIAVRNRDYDIIKVLTPKQIVGSSNQIEPLHHEKTQSEELLEEDTIEILRHSNEESGVEHSDSLNVSLSSTRMSAEQMKRLKAIKISRNNPFTKLTKMNSKKKLQSVKDNVDLPVLSAWLEIKSKKPPYSWVKRWVMVEDTHFLWNDKQRIINDVQCAKERNGFRGNFKLMNIQKIEKINSKTDRMFVIVQEEGSQKIKKEYKFRAASTGDRDHWCDGLQVHIDYCSEMLKYLGTKSP